MDKIKFSNVIAGNITASSLSLEELEYCLTRFNDSYRSGTELVSDHRYDHEFKKALSVINPEHELLSRIEPEPDNAFGKLPQVRHKSPMLSTENAFDGIEIKKFVNRVHNAALEIGIDNPVFRATPKLDGWSGIDVDGVLATRGSGMKGTNITHAFDRGLVPAGGRGQGPGEIIVLKSYFEEFLADTFTSPRNFMSAIISAEDVNDVALQALADKACHFVPYTLLYDDAWYGSGEEFLDDYKSICEDIENSCPYEVDGVVLEAVDSNLRRHMGATSHHHRSVIAVKLKKETLETRVNAIEWTTGRTGVVSPTVVYDTVFLSNGNLSRALAHNARRVIDTGLGVGSIIRIQRSGSVIPKIDSVVSAAEVVEVPVKCPVCNHTLSWDGPRLVCPNTSSCDAQTERRIIHFFHILGNVNSFGPKSVEKIVKAGHRTLEGIYSLTLQEFESLGFGPGESRRFIEELARSQSEPVEDWRFLAAFAIPNLGRGDSRRLLEAHALETLGEITVEEVESIHGFGPLTSPAIVEGLQGAWKTISYLMHLGFTLERTRSVGGTESPIQGKSIVFTGAMESGSRDDLIKSARALGAKSQSSVNKSTDIVVCGARVGKNKLDSVSKLNANGANIQVLSESEYLELISSDGDSSNSVEIFDTRSTAAPIVMTTPGGETQLSLF
jgi:DNA ligase (NAD+)